MKKLNLLLILICGIFTTSCGNHGPKTITDGTYTITYENVFDAENQLLTIIHRSKGEWDLPFKLFSELILNDPRCIDYDFAGLIYDAKKTQTRSFEVLTSADGSVRLYSFVCKDRPTPTYLGITSIKNKKKVTSYTSVNEDETNYSSIACGANDMEVLTKRNGEKIYVIQKQSSSSMINNTLTFEAYTLDGKNLKPCPIFLGETGYRSALSQNMDMSLYNGISDFLEGDELQIPETRPSENPYGAPLTTDRYLAYRFDGEKYKYEAIYYPQDLCDELCNYKYNLSTLRDGKWLIRLDVMNNMSVRYAAWKNQSITEKPSLVLYNGVCYSDDSYDTYGPVKERYEEYIFQNYDYSYDYSWTWEFSYESTRQIEKTLDVDRGWETLMTLEEM